SILLKSPEEAVTMASLVEKETSQSDERARVAAVFYNRIKKGMPLQTDPTVIFAITLGKLKLNRGLTYDDLKIDSPYNTYLVKGLPPGPIANPGLAALQAALHPISSKELYFVADGTGGHAFAATIDEHNKNVAAWRKIQKAQQTQ
ncbi:MAG TPA: endolytic transglycosylase MltG, partial [Dongiaceae bacterium]|nr:endolytic transglycosylase MltG [Dongiaceae bacterium]